MSNEEAILHMILRREELKNSVGDLDEDIKAFDMAIRALEIIQTGLLKDCESCRAELPPVSTEKTGYWIKIKPYPLQMHDYECSECGHETDDNTEKHCSECGAKMEVKE